MSKQYYDENGNPVEVEEKKRGGCLKWVGIILLVIVLVGACSAIIGGNEESNTEPQTEETETTTTSTNEETEATETESEEESEAETEAQEEVSREFRNALQSAENYLDTGMGFSEEGLRNQLNFDNYPSEAIDYAIENIEVDYNEQALISAQNYENTGMGFSDQGMIDQLLFDGFTQEQAQYAVDNL